MASTPSQTLRSRPSNSLQRGRTRSRGGSSASVTVSTTLTGPGGNSQGTSSRNRPSEATWASVAIVCISDTSTLILPHELHLRPQHQHPHQVLPPLLPLGRGLLRRAHQRAGQGQFLV